MREEIQRYRFQHDGNLPSGTSANVVNQLTMATDVSGNSEVMGTAGFAYGPHLIGQLPANPYNGGNGLLVKATNISSTDVDAAAVQGAVKVEWIYSTVSSQIIANSTGNAADGTALSAL